MPLRLYDYRRRNTCSREQIKEKKNLLFRTKSKLKRLKLIDMLPVYYKLFNLIPHSGTMPSTWCDGLVTPIYKSGNKQKPPNYRGTGLCFKLPGGQLF